MPKRTGLGQRGLDLLIPATPGASETDSDAKEKKADSSKKKVKASGGKSTVSKKASAEKRTVSNKAAGGKGSAGTRMSVAKSPVSNKTSAGKNTVSSKTKSGKISADNKSSGGPVMIPISKIEPNREQPRKNFDEDALQELAESIKQFGIIQPLIVQERDGYYEIIAGERRWRAARIASLKEVPVIIREYTSREVMEISLIENIQREDLNPIEEAGAYRRLMEEYNLKQDEVAQRVSKSRAAIANSVRLLNLDARVQDMIVAQMLSTGHARALLAVTDPEQQYQTAQKVFDEKLTVRDVEKLVRRMNEAPVTPVKRQISEALQAVYTDLAERMKQTLGTKVSISPKSAQKGKIEIEYYSADELDRLCTLLNSLPQKEGV